jgi:phospholipid/cholesterol/gamma-HCH transport system substrate-binding protein
VRRNRGLLVREPVLLGAVAVLMSIVAIYFVYTLDSRGLPFVPTYDVQAVLADAESLGKTGDVRLAGVLVGRVHERHIEVLPDGQTRAVLTLALDKSLEPLAADSRVQMRAISTLGGSYVELLPGHSRQPLRGPLDGTHAPHTVSLHDSLEAYDKRTRGAVGDYLTGYGNALVGRGSDVNEIVAIAPDTLKSLDGAMRALPDHGLSSFIDGFARFSGALAPVADQQAGFFRGLDRTFAAMGSVREDVAAATADAPPALAAGTEGFPAQRRLLHETAGLFAALRPGLRAVRGASADIAGASTGAPGAFAATRRLAPRLTASGQAVSRFARDPIVVPSLAALAETFGTLVPTARAAQGVQGVCNYANVLLRNLLSVVSDGTSNGNWISAVAVLTLPGHNSESSAAFGPSDTLHATTTPNIGEGPQPECESGNEAYAAGKQVIGHAPGRQAAATEVTR